MFRQLLKPGTEWDRTPYFSSYQQNSFDLGLGIPKLKFLGLRESYGLALGQKKPEKNRTE